MDKSYNNHAYDNRAYTDSSLSLETFLKRTVNKIYKILPLKEEKNEFIIDYIETLRIELMGATDTFPVLKNDYDYISVINTINYLISNLVDVHVCKREVFKMLAMLNHKIEQLGGDDTNA